MAGTPAAFILQPLVEGMGGTGGPVAPNDGGSCAAISTYAPGVTAGGTSSDSKDAVAPVVLASSGNLLGEELDAAALDNLTSSDSKSDVAPVSSGNLLAEEVDAAALDTLKQAGRPGPTLGRRACFHGAPV